MSSRPTGFVGTEDVVFSFSPGRAAEIPQPFRIAAATVHLCNTPTPYVLLLGFGLGAMADLMLAARPEAKILGVEPDERLLSAARQTFAAVPNIKLRHCDALTFLRRRRSPQRFDLILDDCFELCEGEPRRPPLLNSSAELADRHLEPTGLLVRNLLPDDGPFEDQTFDLSQEFAHVERRRFREWENSLAIASHHALEKGWRDRLSGAS